MIDRIITPGYEDNNIFDYWRGVYSCVFISFKPFFKLVKRKDYKLPYGQYERLEVKIKKKYRPLKWEVIKKFNGFKSFAEIQRGLFTGGPDETNEAKIDNLLENYNLIPPYEDFFDPHQLRQFLNVFSHLGYDQVRFDSTLPEFIPSKLFALNTGNIDDIKEISYANIYTEDYKILIANLHEQHVTLICSDHETVKTFVTNMQLEGFYATSQTNFNWSRQI